MNLCRVCEGRTILLAGLLLLGSAATSCKKSSAGAEPAAVGPVDRPAGPLSSDEANTYMLALVNHDRAGQGLAPVEWDDTAAEAARRHARDMAHYGYTGHWGTDGSVPEQRYTEAGGEDVVHENAACFFDAQERELDDDARFDPVALEKIEEAFMAEVPPNDGHRKNILNARHKRLGVGLAQPKNVPQPCLAHEFVDDYGEYGSLPRDARPGQTITVAGELVESVTIGGVGVARIALAEPIPVADLLRTGSYPVPPPDVLYAPAGYQTPKPVQVDGSHFSIDIELAPNREPGRYEISVWGHFPDMPAGELAMVSLRTIAVQ